jgi:mono/diheme cytochrome c family protein
MTVLGRCRGVPRHAIGACVFGSFCLVAILWPLWGRSDDKTSTATDTATQPAEADSEEDTSAYRSGLIAEYTGAGGARCIRLEEQIAMSWGDDPPDRRIAAGPFAAEFNGHLELRADGTYRLRVFAAGHVRLMLDGKTLVDARSSEPAWMDGQPVELPFGYYPLQIKYERAREPARLALYWEGPGFQLEPVSGRALVHEAGKTPSDAFARGERLVRALRCAACHDIAGEPPRMPAGSLVSLAKNVSRTWLLDWLVTPETSLPADEPSPLARRMPHFGFNRDEAELVADFLFHDSEGIDAPPPALPAAPVVEPAKKKKKGETEPARPEPSVQLGATLLRSLGCLACHRVGDLGMENLFGGGDLALVASKRPADYFARWLTEPDSINPDHRMPLFRLDALEVQSLSLYLQTLGGPTVKPAGDPAPGTERAERGRQIVRRAGCAQCHALPKAIGEVAHNKSRMTLAALERTTGTCLFEPDPLTARPGYRLASDDRAVVVNFLGAVLPLGRQPAAASGKRLLAEWNCLACHARGQSGGLATRLTAFAAADPALRDVLPSLTPPALTEVGDKLNDRALMDSLAVSAPPRHTWFRVRMPKFPFAAHDAQILARHLIDSDRIPEGARSAPMIAADGPDDSALTAAGPRLVTADGFGCTSCHAIGKWKPEKVALNAQGVDLSEIGAHVRPAWFDRWVRNPSRIVPQMEMPSVQQSVRGVLDGNLDRQLAAVWHVLNRPGFTPPSPSALRVVRRSNAAGGVEPAAVLTDLMEVNGRPFVKPLVIGLPNRHNVLVDLATNRLAAWWIGDVARQQTRGKSWHWEAGMPQLLALARRDARVPSELRLLRAGTAIEPVKRGDYLTEFDWFQHVPGGLRFAERLVFPLDGSQTTVRVEQEYRDLGGGKSTDGQGFFRHCLIGQSDLGGQYELRILDGDVQLDPSGKHASLAGPSGQLHVNLRKPADAHLRRAPEGAVVVLRPDNGRLIECELEYRAEVAADEFPPLPERVRSVTRQVLDVVPGFEAVRLPVTDQAMPTGLAWRPDGTLVLSSLEGRVWLAHDSDGDGLEDRLDPFSDELAAPFGVAASGDAVDVINKYGLVRLTDADADGRADRTEVIASGWGHTRDYHDWAVGLPRDAGGNYYVSLPCQQDDRTESGAFLRGTVIKLAPREPTPDDPRQFAIEQLCAGLRFPQGIALSPAGDLFVTDNQGNYTPFNELNHVVKGARYGFINRLEAARGLNEPVRSAAVEIPHPWTRSVNGICFLVAPKGASGGADLYGPLAGQMIGCEYDTRRLVRMSLDRVAGEWQGAVYPFSVEPAAGQETFEGPLVCQIAPNGDVYVGNIRDSGWGAGANTGSLVRLRYRGELPAGIACVRAVPSGFEIDFTQTVDRDLAADAANYQVASYRRVATPAYGGPDLDRRVEKATSVVVTENGLQATVHLDALREGFVYEIHLRPLVRKNPFFPAEAYYTLRHRAS